MARARELYRYRGRRHRHCYRRCHRRCHGRCPLPLPPPPPLPRTIVVVLIYAAPPALIHSPALSASFAHLHRTSPHPTSPHLTPGSSEKDKASDTAVVRNLRRKLNADADDGGSSGGGGLPMLHGGGSDVSNASNSKKQKHGHGHAHQDRTNKRVLVRLKLETRHGYTALGDPADPVVEKLGSVSATTNTNLAMLRLMISQTPSLSVPLEFTFLHPPPGTVGASYDPSVHGLRGFGRRASTIQSGGGGRKTVKGGLAVASMRKEKEKTKGVNKMAKGVPLYGELVTLEDESTFELVSHNLRTTTTTTTTTPTSTPTSAPAPTTTSTRTQTRTPSSTLISYLPHSPHSSTNHYPPLTTATYHPLSLLTTHYRY